MKNYKDSDYAVNKHAAGIVYRFADETVEVKLEAYLAENPGMTEQDFLELKALSDGIYHDQDVADNAAGRHALPLYEDADVDAFASTTLEDEYIRRLDRHSAKEAARQLLSSGQLTETQERRFVLHIWDGLSSRQIAALEGATQRAVIKSLHAAIRKLKKIFPLLGYSPPLFFDA